MSVPNQVCLSHFCFTFPCCNLFFTLTGGYLFQHLQKARSYSVKLYNFYRFLGACAAAIVHRNQFFCVYRNDKSSDAKVNFRQATNHYKRVLEAAKPACANNTKESITSQKIGSCDFWRIANCVLNKGKSVIPPLFSSPRCCLLHLIKQNCFLKTFRRTLILITQGSLYLFSLLELI